MKDYHKCDICGRYSDPDSPMCFECEAFGNIRRKQQNRNYDDPILEGDYDEGYYITGQAGIRRDPDQL